MRSVEEHQRIVAGLITAWPATAAELPDADAGQSADRACACDGSDSDRGAIPIPGAEPGGSSHSRWPAAYRAAERSAGHDWRAAAAGAEAAMRCHSPSAETHRHPANPAGEQVGQTEGECQAPWTHPPSGIAEVGAGRVRGRQTRVGRTTTAAAAALGRLLHW